VALLDTVVTLSEEGHARKRVRPAAPRSASTSEAAALLDSHDSATVQALQAPATEDMASRAAIEEHVRSFFRENSSAAPERIAAFPAGAHLWDEFDSLLVIDLLEYLEKTFQMSIELVNLVPENFGTIERIVTFVEKRLSRTPS
jgi:acyl carrier protein